MDVRNTVMFLSYCEEGRHTVMFWCYVELLCGCKKYSDVLVLVIVWM